MSEAASVENSEVQSLSEEALEEVAKGIAGGVDETGLPKIEGVSADQIREGFQLFFKNKPEEALSFFTEYEYVPLMASGKAALNFVKGAMSLEEGDIQEATKSLKFADAAAHAAYKKEKKLSKEDKSASRSEYVHYRLMQAECKLLNAGLQFLQEGLVEKVKGGLNIRGAWQLYSKQLKENPLVEGQPDHLDLETRGALEFGIGLFNLMCSTLPPKVLRLVAILGFPSDRKVALTELRKAWDKKCVLSPVAGLSLLSHHVLLQSTISMFTTNKYAGETEEILEEAMKRYPSGALFLFMKGRYLRLQRNLPDAIVAFTQAMAVQNEFRPLVHLCHYELGWAHFFNFEFKEALDHFTVLLEENTWSKVFYNYFCGVCKIKLGDFVGALTHLAEIPEHIIRKFNGRMVPVDSFATRKCKTYVKKDRCELMLPDLELMYFWNGFSQMPKASLNKALVQLNEWIVGHPKARGDAKAMSWLLAGAVQSQLGQHDDAIACFKEVESSKKQIKGENWLIPYARFELAMVYAKTGKPLKETLDALKKVTAYTSDYNFDVRLHLKTHLSVYELKNMSDYGSHAPAASV